MTRMYARFAAIALVALMAVPAFAAGPMSTQISVDSTSINAAQGIMLNVTMTNNSDRAVRVLSWSTPLFGVEGDLFAVMHNGQRLPYLGKVYKRAAPASQDFIHFAPGQSRSAAVNLGDYYEMGFTGEYLVNHRAYDPHHALNKSMQHINLGSNQLVLWVEGRNEDAPIDPSLLKKKPAKESCSASQKAELASAMAEAQAIAANASNYLSGAHNSSSPRYNEWFGNYSSSNWNTVDANFAAISDALDNEDVVFNCKCKQNYYAYVYTNDHYNITVCKYFWTAPLTGTDSKAGTIVHEMSHFNVVASTDDVVYGQTGCRNLANSNPGSAIQNADSHEYFAENTPALN